MLGLGHFPLKVIGITVVAVRSAMALYSNELLEKVGAFVISVSAVQKGVYYTYPDEEKQSLLCVSLSMYQCIIEVSV